MKNIKTEKAAVLLIGIGNIGKSDDGIGWKFAELAGNHPAVCCEYRYQLQVEDAALAASFDKIVFVDATQEAVKKGFRISRCETAAHYFYSSHIQTPETILHLTQHLYDKSPEAYTIAIAGRKWGLGTGLSATGIKNLHAAFKYFDETFLRQQLSGKPLLTK